ncbi:MAG: hypothetical protein ACSHX7_06110 [Luteolibacter sp.]
MISLRNASAWKTGAILLALGLCPIASADVPRGAPVTRYTSLWTDSPFTTKPPVQAAAAIQNRLDDYTLTGIAPIPGGYRITIVNRKDPTDKQVIQPGNQNESDFSFVSLERDPSKHLGTIVTLSNGSLQGNVTFEPELLKLTPSPAPPSKPKKENNSDGKKSKPSK